MSAPAALRRLANGLYRGGRPADDYRLLGRTVDEHLGFGLPARSLVDDALHYYPELVRQLLVEMGEILLAYHVCYRELARIVRHDVFVEKELAVLGETKERVKDILRAALGR